jgi:hypothetical protein
MYCSTFLAPACQRNGTGVHLWGRLWWWQSEGAYSVAQALNHKWVEKRHGIPHIHQVILDTKKNHEDNMWGKQATHSRTEH